MDKNKMLITFAAVAENRLLGGREKNTHLSLEEEYELLKNGLDENLQKKHALEFQISR
jgi:hypothetical protein